MIKQSSSAGPCKYLHNYYKKNYVKFLQKKGKKYIRVDSHVAERLKTYDLRKLEKVKKNSKLPSPPPKIKILLILAKIC